MIILGFTTSTDWSSIALLSKGKLCKPFSWTRKEQQSEALTGYLEKYLKKNKIHFSELDLIAVDKGPGSFTGSRIAVNIAKTLAFDLKLPIFTSSSLELMACGIAEKFIKKHPYRIMSLLDAHRSLYYFQDYDVFESASFSIRSPVQALSLADIVLKSPSEGVLCLVGNVRGEIFNSLKEQITHLRPQVKIITPKITTLHFPQASSLVIRAALAQKNEFHSWTDVEPSYIRSPDAVEKLLTPK